MVSAMARLSSDAGRMRRGVSVVAVSESAHRPTDCILFGNSLGVVDAAVATDGAVADVCGRALTILCCADAFMSIIMCIYIAHVYDTIYNILT